jgi:hypothetical protein
MPNFLIIGAPKAGTSSLYYYLSQHPQIYMSPVKEPHFFTYENEIINFKGPGDKERLREAVTSLEDYQKLFQSVSGEIAIGEASTTYLSSVKAPQRIKSHLPEVKLIAILRNPVDAAYASFLHQVRDGDEILTDFALALQQEEKRIRQNWEGIWHYKTRGFYYAQLKRYFELFKREQIRIYCYEDLQENSLSVLKDIFSFLQVNPNFLPNINEKYNVSAMPKFSVLNKLMVKPNYLKSTVNLLLSKEIREIIATKIKNWNYGGCQKPQISSNIREKLKREYREDILNLQDLIQKDLSLWL